MSSRKGTVVTGCTGYVSSFPFNGDYVTRACSECGYDIKACTEFRKNAEFTKIRASKVV